MKASLTFILSFAVLCCCAQGNKYSLSNPLELDQAGWNKVLCLKNGNTMLLHFDKNIPTITIKVFDSTHREIGNQKVTTRILDMTRFEHMIFKGLYAVNNEAVLFVEQEHLSRHGLVRVRFNGLSGKLVDETQVAESESMTKRLQFYVMKNREDDDYAILFCKELPQFKQCDLHVTYYNNKHETVKDIPLDVDRKRYDSLHVTGAESQPKGLCITLNMITVVENQTSSDRSPLRSTDDRHVAMYFIPKDSSKAYKTVVDVSTDVYPYYTHYTYNPFARANNLLVYCYQPIWYKFGIGVSRGSASDNLFFKSDEDNSGIKLNYVRNQIANTIFREKTDSGKLFYGMPVSMYTNENGLTTVISESYERYDEPETNDRYNYETFLGNIAVTQVDDEGKEIWGAILPHSECFKSYFRFYAPEEFSKKGQIGYPFGEPPTHLYGPSNHPVQSSPLLASTTSYRAATRQSYYNSRGPGDNSNVVNELPEQVYERQFLSLNTYNHDGNTYIIYNDYDKNFNSIIQKRCDTVYTFDKTNACYYKINRKHEISKEYLLGTPTANEYKCSFIEGADFDEQRGTYATLVQYNRNDNKTLRMAWVKLD